VAISGTIIGEDELGSTLRTLLARFPRISTKYLGFQPGLNSMYCLILVTPDGERAIVGVNADQVPQTPPTRAMVEDASCLTLDLYGGNERIEAAELAFGVGRPVVVGDVRDLRHGVLRYATVIIASAAELKSGAGLTPGEFARAAQAAGARHVIVTQGQGTVIAFEGEKATYEIEPPAVQVVDTTGAGDTFRAGVVFGLFRGLSLVECTALGTAAGSIKVGRLGGATHPPSLSEVQTVAQRLLRHVNSL
jgi:sugar/nucleoside kinase (ribokinase family)